MPNHVTTIIRGPNHVLTSFMSNDSMVDFNQIVPLPELPYPEVGGLEGPSMATRTIHAPIFLNKQENWEQYRGMIQRLDQRNFEEFIKSLYNHIKIGDTYWYTQQVRHWGTKWNSYDCEYREDPDGYHGVLSMLTAWDAPFPVLQALSIRYPTDVFEVWVAWEGDPNVYNLKWLDGTTYEKALWNGKTITKSFYDGVVTIRPDKDGRQAWQRMYCNIKQARIVSFDKLSWVDYTDIEEWLGKTYSNITVDSIQPL